MQIEPNLVSQTEIKPLKRTRPSSSYNGELETDLENLDINSSFRHKTRQDLEKKLSSGEMIPRKQVKIDSDTESDVSLEPGEIPEQLGDFDLAAQIFGALPDMGVKENRLIEHEPEEFIEHFLTSEDAFIRELDIPERLQSSLKNREYPNEAEINLEVD